MAIPSSPDPTLRAAAEAVLKPQIASFIGEPLADFAGVVQLQNDGTVDTATLKHRTQAAKDLEAGGHWLAAQYVLGPVGQHESAVVYLPFGGADTTGGDFGFARMSWATTEARKVAGVYALTGGG